MPLVVAACHSGLVRLHANDDIAFCTAAAGADQQAIVSSLLVCRMPTILLVRRHGGLLEREERLRRLDDLKREGAIAGYQAVTQWLPSFERQRSDFALMQERLYAPGAALDRLAAAAGLETTWAGKLRADHEAQAGRWLDIPDWLASGVPLGSLWI
jgi:predicted exporter